MCFEKDSRIGELVAHFEEKHGETRICFDYVKIETGGRHSLTPLVRIVPEHVLKMLPKHFPLWSMAEGLLKLGKGEAYVGLDGRLLPTLDNCVAVLMRV